MRLRYARSSSIDENFANVYWELGMTYAALGSDAKLPRDVRRERWSQARSWYHKALDVRLEQQRQGKLLTENAGEPDRLAKEIKKCTHVLAKL
jgi:hypothetical protein